MGGKSSRKKRRRNPREYALQKGTKTGQEGGNGQGSTQLSAPVPEERVDISIEVEESNSYLSNRGVKAINKRLTPKERVNKQRQRQLPKQFQYCILMGRMTDKGPLSSTSSTGGRI
jgi:hypothetical protein